MLSLLLSGARARLVSASLPNAKFPEEYNAESEEFADTQHACRAMPRCGSCRRCCDRHLTCSVFIGNWSHSITAFDNVLKAQSAFAPARRGKASVLIIRAG